jgi:glutamate N-acetyltransferase/amino-acid N-acetyltransferase
MVKTEKSAKKATKQSASNTAGKSAKKATKTNAQSDETNAQQAVARNASGLDRLAVPGFVAGASAAGMKKGGALDVCVIASRRPAVAAGVFTRNLVVGEPVKLCRLHLRHATHRAIVANAKFSNVCTGEEGRRNAVAMAEETARLVGCDRREVFVASTGVIGQRLPVEKVLPAIATSWNAARAQGWGQAARAIMTTDTRPKIAHRTARIGGKRVTFGAIAKGSGMIHPNMGTMFCFIVTDAAVEKAYLQTTLRRVADRSFNCVTVDGDTSTSDTMLVMANGAAGNTPIAGPGADADAFEAALLGIAVDMAREIARDGEGAQHLVTIRVTGARSEKAARQIAHTVGTSPLVKTAIAGRDANWGRIAAAAGRAGVPFRPGDLELDMNGMRLFEHGGPVPFDEAALTRTLGDEEISIAIRVGGGPGEATVWTCDLTHEYITINGDYRT